MGSVGTLAWARETGGALRARDRVRLLVDSLSFLLELLPTPTRRRAGLDQR